MPLILIAILSKHWAQSRNLGKPCKNHLKHAREAIDVRSAAVFGPKFLMNSDSGGRLDLRVDRGLGAHVVVELLAGVIAPEGKIHRVDPKFAS